MTTDFETHPVGTGRRLAELEGLAFARRRTECGCTTDEDAIAAYRAWLGIDLPDPRGIGEAEFVRWRRVAEAIRDRLSGREMVAEARPDTRPDTEDLPGALRGQPIDPADLKPSDEFACTYRYRVDSLGDWDPSDKHGQANEYHLLDRPDPDATHSAVRPIDPADVRVGDRVRVVHDVTIDSLPIYVTANCDLYLLDRPDPDAELVESMAQAVRADDGDLRSPNGCALCGRDPRAHGDIYTRPGGAHTWQRPTLTVAKAEPETEGEWYLPLARFPRMREERLAEARAALAEIRKTHTIELRPTTGDLHA